jgi:hypothetical protein
LQGKIEAFKALKTSTTSAYHRIVVMLTKENAKLTTQLEASQELIATTKKDMKDLNAKRKT